MLYTHILGHISNTFGEQISQKSVTYQRQDKTRDLQNKHAHLYHMYHIIYAYVYVIKRHVDGRTDTPTQLTRQ